MTGFTKGPWFVDNEQGGDDIRIVGHPVWPCTRFGEKGVWDVAHLEILDEFPDEMEANARLIAAAPDLYEALEQASDVFKGLACTTGEAYKAAEAALAKARGE